MPDRNAGFASIAVTFTREFYGKQWDSVYLSKRHSTMQKPWEVDSEKYTAETYQLRLDHLHDAVVLADGCVDELKKLLHESDEQYTPQHLTDQRDMLIVDICSNTDVYNRGANGRDEINSNIAAIQAISNDFQITIGEIKNRTEGQNTYYELYDRLLEANNPAAITFICLKELDRAGIVFRSTESLTDGQVQVCREVLDFMRGPDEFECICNDSYAVALAIRVSWTCYNKTALLSNAECQLTRLKREEWFDIHDLCHKYFDRTDPAVRQPILILLYALSELQITGNFQSATCILDTLEERQFFNSERMRTPFLICNEAGEAKKPDGTKYEGIVISTKDYNGYIRVNGVPERLGHKIGVRFRRSNLGRNVRMPVKNDYLTDLELGIGYIGLSVYRAEGSRERRERT